MLNLLEKLMVLNCQIMFSLAIAEAILMQTFTVLAPSLQRVVPKYLKPVTSANIWPLMIMSAPMLLVLLVMILLFFCANFHCICCCSVCESVSEDFKFTIAIAHKMSSANRGLHMDLPPLEIECGGHGVFLHDLL